MITTEAWMLDVGPADPGDRAATPAEPASLRYDTFSFPDLTADEVLVEPIYGCWEANMDHAIRRDPVDICRQRREPSIVIGNGAVVRVLDTGADVTGIEEGDVCLTIPFSKTDLDGYIRLVHAYDSPGTIGVLAKRTKLPARLLLPIPRDSRHSLRTWVPYLRYFSAWDNWKIASACWHSQTESDPQALVFGWGGGVVRAELELAKRDGFRVAMSSGNRKRLDEIELFATDEDTRRRYQESEDAFLSRVEEITGGRGVAIFLDNIGGTLYRATTKALGRQAVLATLGWKSGMRTWNLRASECISRHIHVHTHVWRYSDSVTIRDELETSEWIPCMDDAEVYGFGEIPKLAAEYASGAIDSYFPIYQVNPE